MKKRVGLGSISILLVIIAFFWSFEIFGYCLGDNLLTALSLPAWSNGTNGTHYTVFYSYLFLIPSLFFSWRYKNDLFAVVGNRLAFVFIVVLLFSSLFMVV